MEITKKELIRIMRKGVGIGIGVLTEGDRRYNGDLDELLNDAADKLLEK
jgi:hypothetical protein